MYLTYRGIRYKAHPQSVGCSNPELRVPSRQDKSLKTSLPSTVNLKYRGLPYDSSVHYSTSPISDPDLESFIAAFWAIVDA